MAQHSHLTPRRHDILSYRHHLHFVLCHAQAFRLSFKSWNLRKGAGDDPSALSRFHFISSAVTHVEPAAYAGLNDARVVSATSTTERHPKRLVIGIGLVIMGIIASPTKTRIGCHAAWMIVSDALAHDSSPMNSTQARMTTSSVMSARKVFGMWHVLFMCSSAGLHWPKGAPLTCARRSEQVLTPRLRRSPQTLHHPRHRRRRSRT